MNTEWRKPYMTYCGLCDSAYAPGTEDHSHPEPQSGDFRAAWLASKLPYNEWLNTPAGAVWLQWKHLSR